MNEEESWIDELIKKKDTSKQKSLNDEFEETEQDHWLKGLNK
jgi:hypothetical protein